MLLSGDRLVKNLSFPEADFKAKQLRGVRKATCDVLHSLLSVGEKSSVVSKEKVPDQTLLHLGVG